jgi:hypothetical protein
VTSPAAPAPAQTIRCLYSCDLCGLNDVAVDVPVRAAAEGVVEWIEGVCLPAVSGDHRARSPACRTERLQRLKIPVEGRSVIGGPVEN